MYVSVLIPTFNRKSFSQLISLNLRTQSYPFIKEIIVADDGDDSERLVLDVPFTVLYYKVARMSIGEKRNFLVSKSTGDYLAHFDTDDIYHRDYLSTSIFNLIKTGKGLSGSSDMIMLDTATNKTYKQRCINMDMINEATMVYTRKYAEDNKFSNTMSSEGISFCKIADIIETEIESIMICLCHKTNTVDKHPWVDDKYVEKIDTVCYKAHLDLISQGNI
jgi:glycosyltransferase involved in cell wall biosynthesis